MTPRIRIGMLTFTALAVLGLPQAAHAQRQLPERLDLTPPIILTQNYQGEGGVPLDVP